MLHALLPGTTGDTAHVRECCFKCDTSDTANNALGACKQQARPAISTQHCEDRSYPPADQLRSPAAGHISHQLAVYGHRQVLRGWRGRQRCRHRLHAEVDERLQTTMDQDMVAMVVAVGNSAAQGQHVSGTAITRSAKGRTMHGHRKESTLNLCCVCHMLYAWACV